MPLTEKEKDKIETALIRAGSRGLTSHQAYLKVERQELTINMVKKYLEQIGVILTDSRGKPKLVGRGHAKIYIAKNKVTTLQVTSESRWLEETAKKYR